MRSAENIVSHLFKSDIQRLNHTFRYSSFPTIRKESVAEHSFWVAYISYMIALELEICDPLLVLEKALSHDLEESVTGDLVRPFKYYSKEMKDLCDNTSFFMVSAVFKNLKNHKEIMENIREAKDSSVEGHLVRAADLISVLIFTSEEIKSGNKHMKAVQDGAVVTIKQQMDTFPKEIKQLLKKCLSQL